MPININIFYETRFSCIFSCRYFYILETSFTDTACTTEVTDPVQPVPSLYRAGECIQKVKDDGSGGIDYSFEIPANFMCGDGTYSPKLEANKFSDDKCKTPHDDLTVDLHPNAGTDCKELSAGGEAIKSMKVTCAECPDCLGFGRTFHMTSIE